MRWPSLVLAAFAPFAAQAQSYTGPAVVIDGDTLVMSGDRIRLFGVDAPESAQTCARGGEAWACGKDAASLLTSILSGKTVACIQKDRDIYGRIVAVCRVGQTDLGGLMVREGLAVALPQFSLDYVEAEARAKSFRIALWGSQFQTPAEYRAANRAKFAVPVARIAARPARAQQFAQATFAFRNCAAARAAGAAPLYRGQPGYGSHMDGDGDGIACEPYRGR